MAIQVHITDSFMVDGVAIYITEKFDRSNRRLLQINGDTREWKEIVDPGIIEKPTFSFNGEEARALHEALAGFYQGSPDLHMVRADLIHERGRVDRMMETMMRLAETPQTVRLITGGD
jgi:hypothetical protein